MIHLKVPDSEDFKTLKMLLQSETGYPPCQQELRGLKVNVFPMSDHRKLSDLSLPKENFLYLVTPTNGEDAVTNGDPNPPDDEEDSDFKLLITDETQNREYSLNFRCNCDFPKIRLMNTFSIDRIYFAATKTVLEIKIDMSMLTNIAVSKQSWTGWPADIADELSLAQIGIPKRHKLSLRPIPEARSVSLYINMYIRMHN
jgi:hypothetical protein